MTRNTKIALEIERKYIIKMPDEAELRSCEGYNRSSILQIYLPGDGSETHRIRRRSYPDKTICTETRKIRIDKMSSTEIEGEITEESFNALSAAPLEGTNPIEKTRHTFTYLGQLFEIDVYPQWKNTAIMETELPSRDKNVEMPDFINILKEVTGDKSYSNAAMSRAFPAEEC